MASTVIAKGWLTDDGEAVSGVVGEAGLQCGREHTDELVLAASIDAFDEDTVNELRSRARDALLTDAIVREEAVESAAADLMSVDGMDEDTAALLTSKGIQNAEDLADLAVDELVELTAMDEERAKALIMTARAPMLAGA